MSTIPPSWSWRWTGPPPATAGAAEFADAIERGRDWIVGLQSSNGGWGAFDVDNDERISEQYSVCRSRRLARSADRRCDGALRLHARPTRRGIRHTPGIRPRWRGRSPICAASGKGRELVRALGDELHLRHLVRPLRAQCRRRDRHSPEVRRAVDWLLSIQNPDGGWGEDGESYKLDYHGYERAPSTASQTAGRSSACWRRAKSIILPWRGPSPMWRGYNSRTVFGKRKDIQLPDFLGFFICGIMAIRNSFRYGLWRAITSMKAGNTKSVLVGI